MPRNAAFKKGFKSQAEKLSLYYRDELYLREHDPLSAFSLASFLNVDVLTPEELGLSKQEIKSLCGTPTAYSGWSALTLPNKKGKRVIVHNSLHSLVRQQSNIMHELSHIICEHRVPDIYSSHNLPSGMRFYDESQEAEATFLGAALQISRPGLLHCLKKKMTIPEIATYYIASEEMANYRINATGVKRQLKYLYQ